MELVTAGHGLNYHNVRRWRAIGEIVEYNIGHKASLPERSSSVLSERCAK
jgi:pyridoxine 5'-phosphate synthase PdxJ